MAGILQSGKDALLHAVGHIVLCILDDASKQGLGLGLELWVCKQEPWEEPVGTRHVGLSLCKEFSKVLQDDAGVWLQHILGHGPVVEFVSVAVLEQPQDGEV